ncbi:hypothetical protein OG235_24620 [Streptomyces sp. NBC_00024]|uniref:hypothetical protein n=1 Tax=Streptomyces sp. NBC_00024 TaxID=2903612 RepID=UPI0032568398
MPEYSHEQNLRLAQKMLDQQGQIEVLTKERDGAYRERAQLLALLAALHPSVIAPAPDVDEDGWQILYLRIGGKQASWHIAPRDAELYAHVEHVPVDDRRAHWDGHTTEEKYAHIGQHAARLYAEARGQVETPPTPADAATPLQGSEEQGAPVDWQAIAQQRERELKTEGEARRRAEMAIARVRLIKKAPSRSAFNLQANAVDDGWDQALDAVHAALGTPERCETKNARKDHPVHELLAALKAGVPHPTPVGLVGRYYEAIHKVCCPYDHSERRPGYAAAANRAALDESQEC